MMASNPRTPVYRGEVVLPLTERQIEMLTLVAHGETASGIARLLGISIHTVKNTCQDARMRLGARTLAEAVYRWVTSVHWQGGCPECQHTARRRAGGAA